MFAASGELAVRFAGSRRWRAAISVHTVTVAAPQSPPVAPAPTPPPKLTPTPKPTPTPTPATAAPPDPTTTVTYPMTDASEGITAGYQECNFGQILRAYPLINLPTGTWVYAIDKLYAKPSDGSAGWHLESSGVLYYNGTYRPVFDWYNLQTGQVAPGGQSPMDDWDISSGWTVTIVQYVWDEGVWYRSDETPCPF
jgi:hypothetical protein